MNKEFLHLQIARYFEAQLSQQEERDLLRQLLKLEGQDPIADEALAVILASRAVTKATKNRKRIPRIRIACTAASIALILGLGVFLIHHHGDSQTFAYVSGKKIHDPNEIKNIILTQLSDIQESSDFFSHTVSSDLDDIREALTVDGI
ncbi:MAG: hypothetical protein K2J58_04695 [Muribaculaceae bacterium]|nr:hypothetical protein [Muribaculaceae bacterium]